MKYKCIKDFWMEDRLRENTPAFSVGNIYDFRPISVEEMRDGCSDLVTMSNNQGRIHYLSMSDINEYFELVGEKQMTALKWEEGKTYRIKPDMADEFMRCNYHNTDIFNIIKYSKLTPTYVDTKGNVFSINDYPLPSFIRWWFSPSDIEYFDLVEHTEEKQEMTSTKTEQEIVVEWLDKLYYVMRNDNSVHEQVCLYSGGLVLPTDLCDFYDAINIYDFIQMRYNQMMITEVGRRKKELLDKRAELELQLAQINKELGE